MTLALRSTIGRSALAAIAAGFLCLLDAGPVEAGLDQWTALGPPGETTINAVLLATGPGGTPTLFAGTPHGIFRTPVASVSWTSITTDSQGRALEPILSLAIDPIDPSHIVAGGSGSSRVYISEDGGVTWRRRTVDPSTAATQIYAVAFDPQASNWIFAATNDGLWQSTDGGDSFAAYQGLPGCVDVRAAAIDPQNPLFHYAGTECGLFKTTDGSRADAQWARLEQRVYDLTGTGSHLEDVIGPDVTALVLDPANAENVYVGTRAGAVFKIQDDHIGGVIISPMTLNNGFVAAPIQMLALDPQQPGVLYAATAGQGIFKGKTAGWGGWIRFNAGLGNLQVNSLAIDATDSRKLYAGTENGVYEIEQTSVLPLAPDLGLRVTVTQDKAASSTTGLHRLIFKITLMNNGPGGAAYTKVTTTFFPPGLKKPLPPGSVSVAKLTSSPGSCYIHFVNCVIRPLAMGAHATITLVIDPARSMRNKVLVARITAIGTAENDVWGVPDAHPADNDIQVQVAIH